MSETAKVPPKKSKKALPILFTLTAFIGAALLFIVEPLVAKLLLPEFGGASTVWTVSTFFFQAIMLVGYLFIHFTAKLGPRRQPWLQLLLVIPALLALPIALPAIESIPSTDPFIRLLLTLLVLVGLPFLMISTTGPLIQRWYSWTSGPSNEDPYFIYAASNLGSFIGLLSYPFLIEPALTLDNQRVIWSVAFAIFLALVAACGVLMYLENKPKVDGKIEEASAKMVAYAEEAVAKLKLRRQLWWIFLAFIPASLQLGLVSYLTTDIASFPLLWIIPLTIYLATMIAAFANKSRRAPAWAIITGSILSLASVALIFEASLIETLPILLVMGIFMVTLALVSYAAHGALAADRPETKYLTKYFVLISLGGAIGGAFNGLVAPFVFVTPIEFPLVLILSLSMLLILVKGKLQRYGVIALVALFSVATVVSNGFQSSEGVVAQGRSFYGAWGVSNVATEGGPVRTFFHGTTIHGTQFLEEDKRAIPTAYYAEGGPLNDLMSETLRKSNPQITVVGLGAGGMAAYANPNTTIDFIEIDQQVIDVAENPELFTYLSDARDRGAEINSIVGDGRLKVEELEDGSQDLIAIDAFSSDSIPVHLLTEEAFALYSQKLKPNGILAVHISNRVFNLEPVVSNNAKANELFSLQKMGYGDPEANATFASWMALTKTETAAAALESIPASTWEQDGETDSWERTGSGELVSWTDDHSSILEVWGNF